MKTKTFTTIIYKEEDMYIAECPEIGTIDQGETIEEAIENLTEATKLYLEESSDNEYQKPLTSFIGAAKGSFSTPEEVDQFIRQERDAWE